MADAEQRRTGSQVLVWLIVAAVPAFTATAFVTRAYHAGERSLAREYRDRGERALQRRDASAAADAFRTALTFTRESSELRLDLALALIASQRRSEARAYLLALRDEQPGDGPVNLELGRLAAGEGDSTAAIRYYHDAIEGAWARDPEQARRTARLELAEFLVRERILAAAQAELISLAAELPDDPAIQERVGILMVDAGMPGRGLPILRSVLSGRPSAAAAAGRAAFALGQDALAEQYLAAARAHGDTDPWVADMLEVLQLSRGADPLLPHLPASERIARCIRNLDAAQARLNACRPAPVELTTEIGQLRATLVRTRVADPDLLERTLQTIMRAETSADSCVSSTPLDRALARIAQRHSAGAQ